MRNYLLLLSFLTINYIAGTSYYTSAPSLREKSVVLMDISLQNFLRIVLYETVSPEEALAIGIAQPIFGYGSGNDIVIEAIKKLPKNTRKFAVEETLQHLQTVIDDYCAPSRFCFLLSTIASAGSVGALILTREKAFAFFSLAFGLTAYGIKSYFTHRKEIKEIFKMLLTLDQSLFMINDKNKAQELWETFKEQLDDANCAQQVEAFLHLG